ncbi:MAG: hypothetical protein JXR55_00705, partial [Candidatus Fermentibacteraceae bacterium]|nr:hypothetical protein [Candidatus Fermentibacteraceae bacterium]
MRLLSRFVLLLAAFMLALAARGSSTGREIIGTGRQYLDHLAADEPEMAYSILTDSLARLLAPGAMTEVEGAATGAIRTGRMEERGFTLSVSSSQGGSRTLWLRAETSGEWRISGDTSLDNVLGNATVICSSFARTTVMPALDAGACAGDYNC